MPRVLIVLYHDFTANSAYHVHAIANGLQQRGYTLTVAVPHGKETVAAIGSPHQYGTRTYAEALADAEGAGVDLLHAWTPREVVRDFCDRYRARRPVPLVVHLEDNEVFLSQASRARTMAAGGAVSTLTPLHAFDPDRGPAFLAQAQGCTLIVERLRERLPAGTPGVVLGAGADESLFFPRPRNEELRRQHGIDETDVVLAYPGNVHEGNVEEVRSLYLAVALLRRKGLRTHLFRTGRDFVPLFAGKPPEEWSEGIIPLGFVDRTTIPLVLAAADFLVQPGRPGPFNDFRLPSKLPEFFALGRPVILPAAGISLTFRHQRDAWILSDANSVRIAEAVRELEQNPAEKATLASNAVEVWRTHFRWDPIVDRLHQFYQRVLAGSPSQV
jgi:glycosyltransferase involved in cell wall biosynthesis